MVCPYCVGKTEVFNSRLQKRNNQVWRRRRCQRCGLIFSTEEKIILAPLLSVKKADAERLFEPDKLFTDILACLKGHKNAYDASRELAASITQKVTKKASNGLISSQDISMEAARTLKRFDYQAYLRFIAEHPSVRH